MFSVRHGAAASSNNGFSGSGPCVSFESSQTGSLAKPGFEMSASRSGLRLQGTKQIYGSDRERAIIFNAINKKVSPLGGPRFLSLGGIWSAVLCISAVRAL